MQYVVRSPDELVEALDAIVADGGRFKSRNQLINVILADWIARERHPSDPFSAAEPDDSEIWLRGERDDTRRKLLGEEWNKYKAQKADVLDGRWSDERGFEQDEVESRRVEQLEQLKKKLKRDILKDLRAELGLPPKSAKKDE